MLNWILNIIRKKTGSKSIAKNRLKFVLIQDRMPVEPDAKKERKSRDRKDFSKFYSSVIRENPSLPIDTSPVEITCFLNKIRISSHDISPKS